VFKHCSAVQKSNVVPVVATIGGSVDFGIGGKRLANDVESISVRESR